MNANDVLVSGDGELHTCPHRHPHARSSSTISHPLSQHSRPSSCRCDGLGPHHVAPSHTGQPISHHRLLDAVYSAIRLPLYKSAANPQQVHVCIPFIYEPTRDLCLRDLLKRGRQT
ncbi:hypothetical protein E2C01_055638 [Portunus trituberculatus]|uniref:Uncharacterized protein n=1 Tax=Portunus trituberculatus TaxID=210409 RepID=A0A5B7GY83_PORTR|nr:hypothetical protein [Portunus trituberculatus]